MRLFDKNKKIRYNIYIKKKGDTKKMKTNLYEEIVAAMHEGNSKEDILSLVNNAEAQVKEENDANKVALDEARARYIKAVYDFYNAIGVKTTMEGAEAQAKLIEKMSTLTNLVSNRINKTYKDNDMNIILDFVKNL